MPSLRDEVEKKVYGWLSDVGDRIGTERVGQVLDGAIQGAARTRAAVDKNFEAILHMANIPSRREYQRMQSKLASLQGSVMNLTRAVQQLRAEAGVKNGGPALKKSAAKETAAKRKAAKRVTAKTSAAAKSSSRRRTTRTRRAR